MSYVNKKRNPSIRSQRHSGVRYPGSTQPARRSLASSGENAALAALNAEFAELYAADQRPSIAPERLLRAPLIQILFSISSERQLMDQLQYNLLFRRFVGLGIDDAVWIPTVFTKNRDRLLNTDIARKFLAAILSGKAVAPPLSMSISPSMARSSRRGPP